MDAKLVESYDELGTELRHADSSQDTWPGYHETAPLGKRGYWYGHGREHSFIGTTAADVDANETVQDARYTERTGNL